MARTLAGVGDLHLRGDMLRRGSSDAEIRRAVRTGELRPLRRGAYLQGDDPRWKRAADLHLALIRSTVVHLEPGAVVSHLSAAVRHDLPVWGVSLRVVDVTRDRDSGGYRSGRLRTHAAHLAAGDVLLVAGVPTTSVARTVIDVGRTAPFETSVAVADAALHRGLVTGADLDAALLDAFGRRGVGRARAVLAFADVLADGPGESRSRVRMDQFGVERPVLQHRFADPAGLHIGTVDFWWREAGIIGEFDGTEKYGRSLRPGEKLGDAVMREKRREDALRAEDGVRTVVRWTWDEIATFEKVAARLPHRPPTRRRP